MIGGYSGYRLFWRLAPFEGRKKEEDCMAKRDSLGEQFRATVSSKLIIIASKTMKDLLHRAAREICASVEDYMQAAGMRNITGNAYRSFTIGIYEDRELIDIVTTEGKNPTMRTLRKGQAYPLDKYYDDSDADSLGRYVGTEGHGGQYGPTLGRARIHSMTPKSRARWQMLCICPVEYAQYDALNHIHNMMSAARDDMAIAIANCAIRVKVVDHVKSVSKFTKYT